MLRVDFYESSDGETIIITFPDGGIGIVDAHPSACKSRPDISDLVKSKVVHFVCLTHPHADHGVDLVKVFDSAADIKAFWHTVSDIGVLLYSITQGRKFPSPHNQLLEQVRKDWAKFLVGLYSRVTEVQEKTPGFSFRINASKKPTVVAGVLVRFLGPEEEEQNRYVQVYKEQLEGRHRRKPDENALSAIISLEYAGNTVVLGSDALIKNWTQALKRCAEDKVHKIAILKVPHHGAKNAHSVDPKSNYLALCKGGRSTQGVLFAGDIKHPHSAVFAHVKKRTRLSCLANGLKGKGSKQADPLGLSSFVPGAVAVGAAYVCNPHVGFELRPDGTCVQTHGAPCSFCA